MGIVVPAVWSVGPWWVVGAVMLTLVAFVVWMRVFTLALADYEDQRDRLLWDGVDWKAVIASHEE